MGSRGEPDEVTGRRGCFSFCCFGGGSAVKAGGVAGRWERINGDEEEQKWWRRALMAAKEWSELLAGPRWKTFLRRLSRSHRGGAARPAKHQYDPLSYALNFDGGDQEYPDFSARFVKPPPPKTVLDLVGGQLKTAVDPNFSARFVTPPQEPATKSAVDFGSGQAIQC